MREISKKPGIYIHIPFCVKKCKYCAFLSYSIIEDEELAREGSKAKSQEEYVRALIHEIELRAFDFEDYEFDTVYFGGGTPTVLSDGQLASILDAVKANYNVVSDAEITLEANPGTIEGSRLVNLRKAGFNRLSMGVQSMDDERLKFLGRIHTSGQVVKDFALAREAGFDNINLDIIFSVPGETGEDALSDIRQIAALEPEHISFYSLQIEEDTPLYESWAKGEFEEISDEEDRDSFHLGSSALRFMGYNHYEISNFAKPGFESRHNSKYWNTAEYLAFGLGASGYVAAEKMPCQAAAEASMGSGKRVRYRNTDDFFKYLELNDESLSREERLPTGEISVNSEHDDVSEAVFTGLRRREGILFADFFDGTEQAFRDYYKEEMKEAEQYAADGFLIIDENGIQLTQAGIDISNRIMAIFV